MLETSGQFKLGLVLGILKSQFDRKNWRPAMTLWSTKLFNNNIETWSKKHMYIHAAATCLALFKASVSHKYYWALHSEWRMFIYCVSLLKMIEQSWDLLQDLVLAFGGPSIFIL